MKINVKINLVVCHWNSLCVYYKMSSLEGENKLLKILKAELEINEKFIYFHIKTLVALILYNLIS